MIYIFWLYINYYWSLIKLFISQTLPKLFLYTIRLRTNHC